MPKILSITEFLELSRGSCILDVRTPKEFEQGHIPGAINLPLFTNEERAIVGTIYKQEGREPAILKGLELVGPKLKLIAETAKVSAKDNTVFVHCWRGGMRSGSVAWLLETAGLRTFTLKGGYKVFRRKVLDSFQEDVNMILLGGRTGSGKTLIIQSLIRAGEQVIDLEGIAHHKGSAFGAIGELPQPSQEQFENLLFMGLWKRDKNKPVWLEDEARLIGKKVIPEGLWEQMRSKLVMHINLPFEERVNYLVKEYGKYPKEELADAINRITKRLGPEQTKISLEALENNDLKTTCEFCLNYYDKTYTHGLSKRESSKVKELDFIKIDPDAIAEVLVSESKKLNHAGN